MYTKAIKLDRERRVGEILKDSKLKDQHNVWYRVYTESILIRTGGVLFSITANTFEMLRSYREDEKLSSKANLEYTIDHLADNKEALMYIVTEVQNLLREEG